MCRIQKVCNLRSYFCHGQITAFPTLGEARIESARALKGSRWEAALLRGTDRKPSPLGKVGTCGTCFPPPERISLRLLLHLANI